MAEAKKSGSAKPRQSAAPKRRRTRKKKASGPKSSSASPALMTLTEVSRRTGISMPTLQKYKKNHSDRIPSEGEGRRQRYPEEALAVVLAIREENMERRGRPSKKASSSKRAASTKKAASKKKGAPKKRAADSKAEKTKSDDTLLPLTEVARRAGIAYATAQKYVKKHVEKIPFVGEGRARKYKEDAVEIMKSLRAKAKGGRPPKRPGRARKKVGGRGRVAAAGAATSAQVTSLTSAIGRLEKRLDRLERELKKPIKVEIKR